MGIKLTLLTRGLHGRIIDDIVNGNHLFSGYKMQDSPDLSESSENTLMPSRSAYSCRESKLSYIFLFFYSPVFLYQNKKPTVKRQFQMVNIFNKKLSVKILKHIHILLLILFLKNLKSSLIYNINHHICQEITPFRHGNQFSKISEIS